MAKAIFTERFNFDFRPIKGAAKQFEISDEPQLVSKEVLAAAIKAGAAFEVDPPQRKRKAKN